MKCLQPPKHEGVLLSNPPQYRCFRLGCQNTWVVGEEAPECSLTPHQKNDVPYNQIDHDHCWRSKNPPCGQKIEHLKCCLCEKLNPRIEIPHLHQKNDWREEFDALTEKMFAGMPRSFIASVKGWYVPFIETLLTQQAERIAEEVEDLHMEYDPDNPRTFLFLDPVAVDGYNVALDDIRTLIRTRNT